MSPQVYRLIINGEIGPRYASAFEGMTVSSGAGKTEITGLVTDQSQLQGLLGRISGLGLTLYSVTPLPDESGESARGRRSLDASLRQQPVEPTL